MARKAILTIIGTIAIFPMLYMGMAGSIVCEGGGTENCEFSALGALQSAGLGLLLGSLPVFLALALVILPIVWVWRKLDGIRIGGKKGK